MESIVSNLLAMRLFSRPEPVVGTWAVIRWWEARRLAYNGIVGIAGLVTCALVVGVAIVAEATLGDPIGLADPPALVWVAILAYGVGANACFTGGWVAELAVLRLWGERGAAFGEISFFLGLAFSVLLTFFPAGLVAGAFAVQWILR